MLKWMAWMLTPEVQTQVAEYFGEAPANPKACKFLDARLRPVRVPGLLQAFGVNDPSFYNTHRVLEDAAQADCGDARGQTCIDYSTWTQKWTEIKG